MSTRTLLVEDLEARNVGGKFDEIINNAKLGLYDDFESTAVLPKSTLVLHLSQFPELEDISEDVKFGKYDE